MLSNSNLLGNLPITQVPALDRSVAILDTLAKTSSAQTLGDIAEQLAIPKSSAHNLLQALLVHGLIRRNEAGGFSLGTKSLQWGHSFNNSSQLMSAFEEAMRGNQSLASETVMLAILDQTEVTYLACHPGSRPLAVNFKVGGRFTASCTSSGKAILSTMSDSDIRRVYATQNDEQYKSGKLYKLTKHSLGTVNALCREMTTIKLQGYAIDDEETAEGMRCFGAPILAAASHIAIAGVAVSTIKASLNAKRQAEVITAIKTLSKEISLRLGGQHQ
jgi:IclR family transcriptional regulator, blcABC operon repressor